MSYQIFNGEIPQGFFVCHKCDNPRCINPNHLFVGTPKDNVMDMINKGRSNYTGGGYQKFGETNHNAKLTDKKVIEIRTSKDRYVDISEKYGISIGMISRIKNYKQWKHVI